MSALPHARAQGPWQREGSWGRGGRYPAPHPRGMLLQRHHLDPDPGLSSVTPLCQGGTRHPASRLPLFLPFADDSLYESPEPIFTSNNSCCSLRVPHAALAVVPVVWTLLAS